MPEYDAGFKIVARTVGRQLAELAGVVCQQWTPLVSEVQATERLADRVFRARRGRERFVVYMEAYTRWNQAAPWSVLAKSGLLSERERLPTLSLVYILLPRGYRPQQGQFRLAVGDEATQQVWFREIRPIRCAGTSAGRGKPSYIQPPSLRTVWRTPTCARICWRRWAFLVNWCIRGWMSCNSSGENKCESPNSIKRSWS
jgi:hypothetical protein